MRREDWGPQQGDLGSAGPRRPASSLPRQTPSRQISSRQVRQGGSTPGRGSGYRPRPSGRPSSQQGRRPSLAGRTRSATMLGRLWQPKNVARITLGVVSLLVLTLTGYAWVFYTDLTGGISRSAALGDGLKSRDGATNILIMGLDSRLDQNGNPLPQSVYDQLHAGDNSNGGYNTNVLMLLHVPNDGSKSTLISIPRDDYVTLVGSPDGVSKEKIKQGYGLAKDAKEKQLAAQGITDQKTLETQGREAGRTQTIKDVQEFLGGVPIDHFVEVTLVGFYDLAQALGSIKVCLQGPTQDSFSGANFVKGYQDLNASQALAFVRQRRDYVHPELNFTDLDRERRQQAFLASAAEQLKSAGTLTDPAKLSAVIDAAKKNIVLDDSFDLNSFIQQSQGLINGGITFTTLPIKTFGKVDGEDVNLVDLNEIRTMVKNLIGDKSSATSTTPASLPAATLDVLNATGQDGLATALENSLSARGMTKGTASSAAKLLSSSTIYYGSGASDAAKALGDLLGVDSVKSDTSMSSGHVRLVVGTDFSMPSSLTPPATSASSDVAAATTSASSASAPASSSQNANSGPMDSIQGGSIPCVK